MHAFDVLGDPVRRRILELLAEREHTSGEVVEVISAEFGISQAGVSQHLKVLRESGFAQVRPEGTRRVYALDATPCAISTTGWSVSGCSGRSGWMLWPPKSPAARRRAASSNHA
ncbi:helix-turn-helix transcriptional regulator [Devosia ginsengisoli]|uniref:ArsR/SmtB family transcription factor n=1 Tax=Devosia ginsengisoli TaxID=400770 RepID=UPI0026EB030A|nr:metalloregulator ArsR/SmtB family transcription factor [Devosia ginsengisoli]MCR6670786.1 metalloregulator ArsR/SmtB family transcription factor [Devosia ginsengisoli]